VRATYGAIPVARSRQGSDLQKTIEAAVAFRGRPPVVAFPQGTRGRPAPKSLSPRRFGFYKTLKNTGGCRLILNSGELWGSTLM